MMSHLLEALGEVNPVSLIDMCKVFQAVIPVGSVPAKPYLL
jgi:hypothetical protein